VRGEAKGGRLGDSTARLPPDGPTARKSAGWAAVRCGGEATFEGVGELVTEVGHDVVACDSIS